MVSPNRSCRRKKPLFVQGRPSWQHVPCQVRFDTPRSIQSVGATVKASPATPSQASPTAAKVSPPNEAKSQHRMCTDLMKECTAVLLGAFRARLYPFRPHSKAFRLGALRRLAALLPCPVPRASREKSPEPITPFSPAQSH